MHFWETFFIPIDYTLSYKREDTQCWNKPKGNISSPFIRPSLQIFLTCHCIWIILSEHDFLVQKFGNNTFISLILHDGSSIDKCCYHTSQNQTICNIKIYASRWFLLRLCFQTDYIYFCLLVDQIYAYIKRYMLTFFACFRAFFFFCAVLVLSLPFLWVLSEGVKNPADAETAYHDL